MVKTYTKDGIEYCKSNHRMCYNSEFHDQHGKGWSKEDLAYMVQMRPHTQWADISLALGRTHGTCMSKYYMLKKRGLLEYYKNLEID